MKFSKNSAESLVNSCIMTEEHVVILKQEIAGLRQQMAHFVRCNNILRQYSASAGRVLSQFLGTNIAEEKQVSILGVIQEPRTSQMKVDADVCAVRVKCFFQHWLGMPFLLTLDETQQERLKKKRFLDTTKEYSTNMQNQLAIICENDNVNWQEWTYKNIPVERKLRAYRQLRKFACISDIPTYRCESYWLEKKLIEKFYRHNLEGLSRSNGGNEEDEDDLSWDSELEQLAGQSNEDVEDRLFGEGDEDEGSSSQPPARRRRDDTFN
ncbi:hypothetical protein A0J61_10661 [Choanephora cucurbitarum]|uniref:Uncharacterized protein n=1 Tax=Choanephora cucurbitarum TaxID=101091 RepID=A0A1C7MWW3_9FUNG|nr:hypothetical protein A0J61_10661 [Choanephora cucurbitarum]